MKYELPGNQDAGGGKGAPDGVAGRVGLGIGALVVTALLFGFARSAYQPQSRIVATTGEGDVAAATPVATPYRPGTSAPAPRAAYGNGGGIAPASAPYLPPAVQSATAPAAAVTATVAPPEATGGSPIPASVRNLRETFTEVQKFDQEVAWKRSEMAVRTARVRVQADRPEVPEASIDAASRDSPPLVETNARQNPVASPDVYEKLDALAITVALYGHPDRFPKPLRQTAGEAAGEMRVYLKTAEAAQSASDDKDRDALRIAAAAHLARAGQLTSDLQMKAGKKGL